MTRPLDPPRSQRAEEAVLGAVLRDPSVVGEVVGSLLEPEHFYFKPYRLVYEEIVERYYADDPIDALIVAESVGPRAADAWKLASEREAIEKVLALPAVSLGEGTAIEHAALIKRHADFRALLRVALELIESISQESDDPDAIAAAVSSDAMKIATDQLKRHETLSYREIGKRFTIRTKQEIAARQAGVELGAFFNIRAIDNFTKGLRPGEVMILGGEPGVGKSAVGWKMGENFALRQSRHPAEQRVGTLIFSLEMGEDTSSTRLAQSVAHVDGEKLRTATLTPDELNSTARVWAERGDLPLWVNHSGFLRGAQMRAITTEAIRRHNIGLVIIDHFRYIRPDARNLSANEADDEVVMFLTQLADDLNIAIVCLAHTTKTIERADKRPRMGDLRGSGMISAFADFVAFVFRPYKYATEQQKERGVVAPDEAELIWEKSRHSGEGTGEFMLDLSTMTIR